MLIYDRQKNRKILYILCIDMFIWYFLVFSHFPFVWYIIAAAVQVIIFYIIISKVVKFSIKDDKEK